MITNVLITGDTHRGVGDRLSHIKGTMPEYIPEETAVIILGDAGLNFHKNKKDWKVKEFAASFGYILYCLRGNHEDRASNTEGVTMRYDDFVDGYVWVEKDFPNIRYFSDEVAEYEILGKKILCIPGAYSVDKWYRLRNKWTWFEQEQLTEEEMKRAEENFSNQTYDLVLSHTAPIDWEPTDLFLNCVDQSTVDKTTEVWLNKFKEMINWKVWLFGHYHADRLERPYVEQFYEEVEDLDSIWNRWKKYAEGYHLDWWLPMSPNFHKGIEE